MWTDFLRRAVRGGLALWDLALLLAVVAILVVMTGCTTASGERGGYITDPDSAVSVTETGISGGTGVLVGGDLARCTIATRGTPPETTWIRYVGARCEGGYGTPP